MKRAFHFITGIIVFGSFFNAAYSQGAAVFDPLTHTSHLPGGMSYSTENLITTSNVFMKDFDQHSMHPILAPGGNLNAFRTTYSIKGNRFFFDDWVKGVIVKNSGELIDDSKYYFNFDKVNDNLLVTVDKEAIIEVYKDSVKSIKFKEKDKIYFFEKVIPIQRYRFVQVLVKDNNGYSLYKTINTRFIAANYTTNGLTESGQPFDEHVDVNKYYIMYKDEVRPVELKFTSIKKALKENSSMAKDFYADYILDEVDETYLTNIVAFMNR
jgi:hypothetical protein